MPAGYSFRPRLWAVAAAAAACAAGILLGNWQAGRAEQKRAAEAGLERTSVRGSFLPEHTVFLDNKVRRGRAGYEVVTPLRLSDGKGHVLVNRGWVAAGPSRETLPEVRTPAGEATVEGIVRKGLPRVLQAGPEQRGRLRQNLDTKEFAAETGLALRPFVIEQHAGTEDGLLREWPRPEAGAEKNEMYALQWYSLAGLSLALLVALSWRKNAK
jgi:surfeit locus 1 family protein